MFLHEIERAIATAPRTGLPALAEALWRSYAAGAIGEDDAQALAEAIEARKVIPAATAVPRRTGSRPRSSSSMQRRRSWAAGSWLPPTMAAMFTQAENAALAVIIREIATSGSCRLAAAAIAGRAGISTTSARNAVREARKRGIFTVVERRISYDRNEPNVITIASKELALWVRTRARDAHGGGVKSVRPTTNHLYSSPSRPAESAWKKGSSGGADRKFWAKSPIERAM